MAATNISFRWLDVLEKEFDKAFVNLDILIGDVDQYDLDETDFVSQAHLQLQSLSACFAQLTHKAQTIFQNNAKLEAELVHLRHELINSCAARQVLQNESHQLLLRLHSSQLQIHSSSSADDNESCKIRQRLEKELDDDRDLKVKERCHLDEADILRRENEELRKMMLNLQGELSGAKLASKYLDKELAGRIQQIQLLGRNLCRDEHEKLWRQLEAEIYLQRHKTVVRACRNQQTNCLSSDNLICNGDLNGREFLSKPICKSEEKRVVTIDREIGEGLGMSITGGREHGVPILISALHENTPVARCGKLFVGDAIKAVNGISLKEATHTEAVEILSREKGPISLEVIYVSTEEDENVLDPNYHFQYQMFDDGLANGSESRASVDSIRGSVDHILGSVDHESMDQFSIDDFHENGAKVDFVDLEGEYEGMCSVGSAGEGEPLAVEKPVIDELNKERDVQCSDDVKNIIKVSSDSSTCAETVNNTVWKQDSLFNASY